MIVHRTSGHELAQCLVGGEGLEYSTERYLACADEIALRHLRCGVVVVDIESSNVSGAWSVTLLPGSTAYGFCARALETLANDGLEATYG